MDTHSEAKHIRESFENRENYQEFEEQPLHNQTSKEAQYFYFLLCTKFPNFEERQQVWNEMSNLYPDFLSEIYWGKSIDVDPALFAGKDEINYYTYPNRKAAA